MTFAVCLFGSALVFAAPTNSPAAFSTETERTFAVPDISERNVWLDCGMDFAATASNRVEIAFGPDRDGDGVLGDDEAPFSLAVDCGRVVARDGTGLDLHSELVAADVVRLSLIPAHGVNGDMWKLTMDGTNTVSGVFADRTSPLASWTLARVRLSGPEASSAQIALQRNRHATVFIVR